ncbi:hypothetical protein Tco_1327736 [Tanacetum coccineum]
MATCHCETLADFPLDCGSNGTNLEGGVSGGAFDWIGVVDAFFLCCLLAQRSGFIKVEWKLVYVELFVVLSMVMIMGSLKNEGLEYHRGSQADVSDITSLLASSTHHVLKLLIPFIKPLLQELYAQKSSGMCHDDKDVHEFTTRSSLYNWLLSVGKSDSGKYGSP